MTPAQQLEAQYRFTERVAILLDGFDPKKSSLKNATKRAEEIARAEVEAWMREASK